MEVCRKPFKAMEFMKDEEVIRIEEGFTVSLTLVETGENFEGVVTKLAPKEIQLKQEGENFERVFDFEKLADIKEI